MKYFPVCFFFWNVIYGSGLRLMECVRLRVKDMDFSQGHIVVRNGKGGKDRDTMLPEAYAEGLKNQLDRVKTLHEKDKAMGYGNVYLWPSIEPKCPKTADLYPGSQ